MYIAKTEKELDESVESFKDYSKRCVPKPIFYLTVYLFKENVPENFPFIHKDKELLKTTLVVEKQFEEPISGKEQIKEAKRIFKEHKKWFKSYAIR